MRGEPSKLPRMFKDYIYSLTNKTSESPSLEELQGGHITTWRLRQRAPRPVLRMNLHSFAATCGPVAELWLMKVVQATSRLCLNLHPYPTMCDPHPLAPSAG